MDDMSKLTLAFASAAMLLAYLGLAIAGALGFLLILPQLFAADHPSATLANLVEHE